MNKDLIIVESPAKCKKIESFTDGKCKVIASFGHLRSLNDLKHVNIADGTFSPTFTNIPSKEKQIKMLQKEISNCKGTIYIAVDNDREGEAIGWHICSLFNLPTNTTKRIIFNEITKPAVLYALEHPTTLDLHLVQAQITRQILDLLVGFKISPLLWKYIANPSQTKTALSAGRCQTPSLRLVHENEIDIRNHPPKYLYQTNGLFGKLNASFQLSHSFEEKEEAKYFLEQSIHFEHLISNEKEKKVTHQCPKPFTTSDLQQTASNELRMSPKDTMKIAQTLYEAGFITYIRTDSRTYSNEFLEKIEKYIKEKWRTLDLYEYKGTKQKNKNAQEAHESIRPTNILLINLNDEEKITKREASLYKLIWNRTVESCMKPAICNSMKTKITSPLTEKQKIYYSTTTEKIVFPGFYVVKGLERFQETEQLYDYFKNLKEKSIISYNEIESKPGQTGNKNHYTESRLIQLLEAKGIGRPSTYASLIEKIQEREYVKKRDLAGVMKECDILLLKEKKIKETKIKKEFGSEKSKLVICELGEMVSEFLYKHVNEIFDYEFTEYMENELDKIAKNEKNHLELCNEVLNKIKDSEKTLSSIESQISLTKVKLNDEFTFMRGKYGYCIQNVKEKTYLKIKKKWLDTITIEEVRNRLKREKVEELLKDLIETNEEQEKEKEKSMIGKIDGINVYIKLGKFGWYCEYMKDENIERISLNSLQLNKKASIEEIRKRVTIEMVKGLIENKGQTSSCMRDLGDGFEIRNGKYGPYIYYKIRTMKKPVFFKIPKGLKYGEMDDVELMKWIRKTYDV